MQDALEQFQELVSENPRDFRPYLCQVHTFIIFPCYFAIILYRKEEKHSWKYWNIEEQNGNKIVALWMIVIMWVYVQYKYWIEELLVNSKEEDITNVKKSTNKLIGETYKEVTK